MSHPYQSLPPTAFWKTAVSDRSLFDIADLWRPKFNLRPADPVATFGSCFAQHIGRALKREGFAWLSTEPAPRGMDANDAKTFNYDVFTCRTGNIYTVSLLKQWLRWALDGEPEALEVWRTGERWFDPFRPNIEPDGFATEHELRLSRRQTVRSLKAAVQNAGFFVFTLGLTEGWLDAETGCEYPMCPGTAAGEFVEQRHRFVNRDYVSIHADLSESIDLMRRLNPDLKFILTVSPVPLTATKSGHHVLVATTESKSILRAVAGRLAAERDCVDYFPSYEIINSPPFRAVFFEPNLRSVNPHGVNIVMNAFFAGLRAVHGEPARTVPSRQTTAVDEPAPETTDDVVCEEELLAAFARPRG